MAYHAQTNSQLEHSNLKVKIALRHLLLGFNAKKQCLKALPQLQAIINNFENINSTKLSLNKIIYGFCTREPMNFLPYDEHEPDPIKMY